MRDNKDFKQTKIGKIPKDWRVVKLRDVVDLINGRAFKPSEWSNKGLPIIRIQNLNDPLKSYNYCNFKVPDENIIDQGDVLLAWSGTPGTSFGVHIWRGGKAVLNQHIFKIIFKSTFISKKFFVLSANYKLDYLISKAHGGAGLKHVTKNVVNQMEIPLPPLPEQQKIAEILSTVDSAIEKVNQAIAKTQRLKKGLMQELLTKGLPVASATQTGIGHKEFKNTEIGRIPKEWEVVRLGEVFSLEYGKGLTEKERENGEYPVYGSNGVVGYHSQYIVKGPGIIVGRKGTIGAITWSDRNFWPIDTTYYILLKKHKTVLKWLFYKLSSLKLAKLNMATGTPGLNRDLVYKLKLPLPSISEQQKIAEIL